MIQDRLAVRLGLSQLSSVTLAISHLIEQQYAQKLTDEQFADLERVLYAVFQRGRNSAIIPWYDSFKWSHTSSEINHLVSGSTVLGNTRTGSIRTELVPKDPAIALNLFIKYLLKLSEKTDEDGVPIIFVALSDKRRERISDCIQKVLDGNIKPIQQEEELKQLMEKLQ